MFRLSTLVSHRPTFFKLTTTVVAAAVVTATALPLYNDHVKRTHRAHARAALLNAAQWMERTATARGRYPIAAAIPGEVLRVEGERYAIAAISNDGMAYTLTAVPNAAQTDDRCGAYRINQAGTRLQIATAEVPIPLGPLTCWPQ
jgi:type IV pilus assembly protein PilE